MSILEVKDLCKSYPGFSLDHLSFSLREGMITGFIGRNGAGKSTTLKSMLGFCHPDSGVLSFFDMPFGGNEQEIKEQIGYISGGFEFYPNKKLKAITAVTRHFYQQWDDAVYRRCLELFSLDENKTPAKLSAGMRVKYGITLAISHHAKLLLLDEPTSGLDPISRDELMDIFLDLKKKGVTILFSTHITSDLERCADRILYIRDGKILADADLASFVMEYCLAEMSDSEYSKADKTKLIGCRKRMDRYTALMKKSDVEKMDASFSPATVETVMVYLERGDRA